VIEVIAALAVLLAAALGWGVFERQRANAAAARARLDRQRVRTEADRRAADKAADEVHAAATGAAELAHADAVAEVDKVADEIEGVSAAEALRRAFGGSLVLALLLFPAPAAVANPCAGAVGLPGDRVSVSARCARSCAKSVAVTVPKLRADLSLCNATARADLAHAAAGLSACNVQVAVQRRLLEPPPWYRSPWIAGALGVVAGGSIVYAVRR